MNAPEETIEQNIAVAVKKPPVRRRRAPRRAGRVTISDIAARAGVSKTAVSFAFNVPGRLAKETSERILEVARQMGYMPNPIARSLNTRRTHAIGLIVPQNIPDVMKNPFFAELMRGIGEVCTREGMSLILIPPMLGSLVDATYTALMDGCIVTGLEADDAVVRALTQRNIPFVMIDADAPHVTSVLIDDFDGARMTMSHVLERGHRRITLVSFRSRTGRLADFHGTIKRRLDGYLAALAECGLTMDSPGISLMETDLSLEGGTAAFERLLAAGPLPTAVVTFSDVIAWGVLEAAKRHGLRVPEDMAIVGFDDLPASRLLHPGLTTVRQNVVKKGRQAAELFIANLRNDEPGKPQRVVLPVELVIRASS